MAPGMIGIPFHSEAGWPSGRSSETISGVALGGKGVKVGMEVGDRVGATLRACYELSKNLSNRFSESLQHQDRKGQEMQTTQGFGSTLEVTCQPAETRGPGKATFHHPAAWQEHKAFLGFWQLDDDQVYACGLGILFSLLTGVAFIDKSDFNRVLSDVLNVFGQLLDLCSFLLVGGRDVCSQEQPKGIDSDMNFAAFLPFVAIVAGSFATFRRGLHRPTVKNDRRRLFFLALGQPQQGP